MSDHIQEDIEPDINLLDLLIALGQEKWTLIVVTVLAALTGVVISLVMPATYVARTTFMPSQQSGNGASLGGIAGLSGLSGLANLAGVVSNTKSSEEFYIALMRSHSVQSSLIDEFKLMERYGARNIQEARQSLSNYVAILTDKKSGMLVIDVFDKDPEFAAQIANAHVNELNVVLSRLAVTESQKRRAYFEQQIIKTQAKIPQLELEFKDAQKNSGLELASLLSEVGVLPGQIAAKELQMQVLRRFATDQNPDLKRLAVEVSALRAQMAKYDLSKSESTSRGLTKHEKLAESTKTNFVQKATQAYNTLKIQESLLDGYLQQFEIAKVDEAKEGPSVQVVDLALAPEARSKPERKKLVIAYTVTGLIIAFVLAALRAFFRHTQSTKEGQQRWSELKRAWGFA